MAATREMPIRVLHIVTNMSYGGLENLLMNYYRNIDRSKIQFDFLTHVDIHQDFEEEIAELGGKLYRLPKLNPFSSDYLKRLDGFFRDHPEYRIVHCHLDCMAGIPLKYAKKNNIPVRIAHSHNSNQTRNLKLPIKLACKKLIPKYATDLFACGKRAGDWMFEGRPYTVMSNAIEAGAFRYSAERALEMKAMLDIQGSFVLGHVGQFRDQKNHLFLIDIFNEILKQDENCILVLVGKGPYLNPTEEKVRAYGISDKVRFLGARSDIADIMQAMDVFVLPSLYEGLPVTMIEAQAAGLACVISDKVPIECKITESVNQVALSAPLKEWTEVILNYKNGERKDAYMDVAAAGFDIGSNAIWLEEFYCNAYKQS